MPAISRGERVQRADPAGPPPPLARARLHGVLHAVEGKSTIGTAGDELDTANIQDATNPFDDPRQFGPNRPPTRVTGLTLSAMLQLPLGFRVAPIFIFRSALPVYLIDGRDLNLDGELNDIPATAYRAVGFDADSNASTIEDIGACETVNCGRGRRSRSSTSASRRRSRSAARMRIEAIGEVFNLFNAINPAQHETTNRRVIDPDRCAAASRTHAAAADAFAGDFQQPEQRVGQIGFRFTF